MKRTKFLKCDPCNTPKKTSKDRVVATSQILEIDGERAVEISLFFGGDLVWCKSVSNRIWKMRKSPCRPALRDAV